MQTIEVKMTWASAVEIFLMTLESGTDEGKRMARAELRAMAKALDTANERYENVDGPEDTRLEEA